MDTNYLSKIILGIDWGKEIDKSLKLFNKKAEKYKIAIITENNAYFFENFNQFVSKKEELSNVEFVIVLLHRIGFSEWDINYSQYNSIIPEWFNINKINMAFLDYLTLERN
jgi:hypothetical protein